jgi:hypothetical protein
MKTVSMAIFFVVSVFAQSAWAACSYNGQPYPTGTRMGDLTCQPNGEWR